MSKQELRQWFDQIDKNKDGSLSPVELQQALALGKLEFDIKTIAHLIRVFDRTKSGCINFEEFEPMHKFLIQIQKSFMRFDKNEDGKLDPDELYQAVHTAGFQLHRPAFNRMMIAFDPEHKQYLTLVGYISMTLFMKSANLVFAAYDPQNLGRVSFSFDEFIYAAANVL